LSTLGCQRVQRETSREPVWTRPIGHRYLKDIRLGSPATDALGEAGATSSVDNHVAAKIGGAVLQTALVVAGNLASRAGDGTVQAVSSDNFFDPSNA
jgi:type IV secretion system protein VirB10